MKNIKLDYATQKGHTVCNVFTEHFEITLTDNTVETDTVQFVVANGNCVVTSSKIHTLIGLVFLTDCEDLEEAYNALGHTYYAEMIDRTNVENVEVR